MTNALQRVIEYLTDEEHDLANIWDILDDLINGRNCVQE